MTFNGATKRDQSLGGLRRFLQSLTRRLDPLPSAAFLEPLDKNEWSALRIRHSGPARNEKAKFTDAPRWIRESLREAKILGLHRRQGLRILDIGCGPGFFLYVCQRLGHNVIGVDVDQTPLFRETVAILKVQREIARISPFEPLTNLGGPFDFITAFGICFDKVKRPNEKRFRWGVEEWRFFLDDVVKQLEPGGQLILRFNPRPNNSNYPRELRNLFREKGALISGPKVVIRYPTEIGHGKQGGGVSTRRQDSRAIPALGNIRRALEERSR
jgi:SAM-dependent methyltransferase